MSSPEKTRVVTFFFFFLALIAFAILYRPTNALSHPADQSSATVLPAWDTAANQDAVRIASGSDSGR